MSPKLATVSRVSQLCVLCGMSYTGQGEHVETKSILKLWDNQGGITSMVGGTAATARNGSPYREDRIRPTLLPVCPAPGCNDWLNVQFEHPGQHLVKDVLLENIHILTGGDVVQFSKWWMKTLFLLKHPDARSTSDAKVRISGQAPQLIGLDRWDVDRKLYHDFRSTGQFPDDLSLWMTIEDPRVKGTSLSPDPDTIYLPTVVDSTGRSDRCHLCDIGCAVPPGRMLRFHFAYHPLSDLVHPFEAGGLATRLWPNPSMTLDFAGHPVLNDVGVEQWRRLFAYVHGDELRLPAGQRVPLGLSSRPWPSGIQPV